MKDEANHKPSKGPWHIQRYREPRLALDAWKIVDAEGNTVIDASQVDWEGVGAPPPTDPDANLLVKAWIIPTLVAALKKTLDELEEMAERPGHGIVGLAALKAYHAIDTKPKEGKPS